MTETTAVETPVPPVLDFLAIAAEAMGEGGEDLTVNQSFDRPIPRAGVAWLRLRSYIELGVHKPKDPTHNDATLCILEFELKHPDHMYDTDSGKKCATLQLRLRKGSTAKSGYKKVFNMMNEAAGGHHKGFLSMIGVSTWSATIYHNVVGEGAKAKTYANLDNAGAYSFRPCGSMDEETNQFTPRKLEPLQGTPCAFLWENAAVSDANYKAMWESIFIDGTYDKTNADKTVTKMSKNFHQDKIKDSINYAGSRLQGLIEEFVSIDEGLVLPEDEPVADNQPAAMQQSTVVPEEFATVDAAAAQPAQEAAVAAPVDALAAMAASAS